MCISITCSNLLLVANCYVGFTFHLKKLSFDSDDEAKDTLITQIMCDDVNATPVQTRSLLGVDYLPNYSCVYGT